MALATLLKSPMLPVRPLSSAFTAVLLFSGSICICGQVRRPEDITTAERTAAGAIRGRVVMPNGSFADEAVKITISSLRGVLSTIYAETQGQFEFTGMQPGTYYLEFEANRQKYEVTTETVQVYKSTPTVINVTLRPIALRSRPGSSPEAVSVAELKQKVPDNARKEFEKASLAGSAGQTEEAISHLRKAIALFPSFVRAHNDLGTYFLAQGNLDAAEEELQKAIALDASAFNPRLNLGIVLVHKQAFAEALEHLHKALSLEPNSPAAHLYSGLSLAAMEKFDPAEIDFKAAYSLGGSKFGIALYHLGQLYMTRGDTAAALKSYEEYLSVVPDAKNAQQVKQLIALLRR